jgi:hypothetical protein
MALLLYDFHYGVTASDHYLSCGRLAAVICERWSRRCAAGGGAQGDHKLVRNEEGLKDGDTIADLDDIGLWEAVAALQWVIVSDHVITMHAMNDLLAALAADGQLDGVRQAVYKLVAAISAKYPALARASRPALVQLVALGRDMAIAAGDAPDFFEFVKKELQTINLGAALLGEPAA